MLAIASCLCARALAQDNSNLLHAVAANYRSLSSFEISGELQADIPGSPWKLHVRLDDALLSPQSPLLKYGDVRRFSASARTISDSAGNPGPRTTENMNVMMPEHAAHFTEIDSRILNQRQLPDEAMRFNGSTIQCAVFEVTYDRKQWKPEEQTIKYWIDPKHLLVVKQEFAEWQVKQLSLALYGIGCIPWTQWR